MKKIQENRNNYIISYYIDEDNIKMFIRLTKIDSINS